MKNIFVTILQMKITGGLGVPHSGAFLEIILIHIHTFLKKRGQVRTITKKFIDLTYDPKWIAYQKTGACEAISIFLMKLQQDPGLNQGL
jgi:hypothetical protein